MRKKISKKLRQRKQRIKYRLREIHYKEQDRPMFSARNIHYDIADRSRGLAYGGIGCMQLLAGQTGLVQALNDRLKLLKRHVPYYESDHVLNIAYNILCNGDCLEDIERLRNDEVYLASATRTTCSQVVQVLCSLMTFGFIDQRSRIRSRNLKPLIRLQSTPPDL